MTWHDMMTRHIRDMTFQKFRNYKCLNSIWNKTSIMFRIFSTFFSIFFSIFFFFFFFFFFLIFFLIFFLLIAIYLGNGHSLVTGIWAKLLKLCEFIFYFFVLVLIYFGNGHRRKVVDLLIYMILVFNGTGDSKILVFEFRAKTTYR